LRIRDALLAVLFFGLLYVPFLEKGRVPIGSLGIYVQSFRFNAPLFVILERILAPQSVVMLAVLAGIVTAICLRRRSVELSASDFAWPMAASLLCAPVVYPWYLLWLLPFMRSISALPIILWTLSIIPTYYVWYLRALRQPWLVPDWIMMLEYGSVAFAAAIAAFRRVKRSAALQDSAAR
jgi:hypothetical protein